MNKFLVVSHNRSGSHFLNELLDSHPDVRCYWELFWRGDRTGEGFTAYGRSALARFVNQRLLHRYAVPRYLDALYARAPAHQVTGLLVKYYQVARLPGIVAWARHNDVKIVHLVRANPIMRLIACEARRKTGISHAVQPVAPTRVRFDPLTLLSKLERNTRDLDNQRRLWRRLTLPYYEVEYESLLHARRAECRRLLEFLDVDPRVELQCKLVKTEVESPPQLIDNYAEVEALLAGTPYERYLQDAALAAEEPLLPAIAPAAGL